ncbi:FeoA family protein [Actinomadura formosensis]|uniref:FeoA family protein n=1 Tax=Actinomadura formosensis TaxID=60706 RepID=UPI00082AB093|nr:FeoA family protein [Actinomadura formosensis]
MTPREATTGAAMRLSRVTGDRRHRRRLVELGFVPGADVSVIARGVNGGLILALGDARVAVDAGTAATLLVEPSHD